jgi:hypothetical protein
VISVQEVVVLVLSIKTYLQTVKRVERLEEEFAMWRSGPAGISAVIACHWQTESSVEETRVCRSPRPAYHLVDAPSCVSRRMREASARVHSHQSIRTRALTRWKKSAMVRHVGIDHGGAELRDGKMRMVRMSGSVTARVVRQDMII